MSTIGSTVRVIGQPDTFGGHYWAPADHAGPSSYTKGGYALDPKSFGFDNTIWTVTPGVDQSATFMVVGRATVSGRSPVNAVWISLDSGSIGGQTQVPGEEVAAGTNLAAYIVRLGAIGE